MGGRALALVFLGLLSLTACVPIRQLEVSPDNAIKPFREGGDPTLRSTQRYDVIVRVLTDTFTNRAADFPALLVAVMNPTAASLDFSAANLTAHSAGRSVYVYSFESYRRRVRFESVMSLIDAVSDAGQGGVTGAIGANMDAGEIMDLKSAIDINGQMLTAHTIEPGRFAGGVVRLDATHIRTGQPLVMQVNLDGDVHEFRFAVHR